MSFRAAICPGCHKNIQVPSDLAVSACPYCAHAIRLEGAAPAPTVSTLLGIANTAIAAGNNQEAIEYYNRVLESEPTNGEAWFGKGRAAGWLSSLAHMRFPEMLIAFNHAIATASDELKAATIAQAVEEANRLVVTLYGMGRKNMMDYVSLENSWQSYLEQVSQMLDTLEEISKRQQRPEGVVPESTV